jgi:hypothetical protein
MHGLSRYKPVKEMLNSSIKTNYLCLGYCLIKRYKKMEADVQLAMKAGRKYMPRSLRMQHLFSL